MRTATHRGRPSTGASPSRALYLFTYYLGSSVFGTVAGRAWTTSGWAGVVTLAVALFAGAGALAMVLRRTPTLLTGSRR
jgi:YNFM family putative membrane transporter